MCILDHRVRHYVVVMDDVYGTQPPTLPAACVTLGLRGLLAAYLPCLFPRGLKITLMEGWIDVNGWIG